MSNIADDVKTILSTVSNPATIPPAGVDFSPLVDAINASTAATLAALADIKAQLVPTV